MGKKNEKKGDVVEIVVGPGDAKLGDVDHAANAASINQARAQRGAVPVDVVFEKSTKDPDGSRRLTYRVG